MTRVIVVSEGEVVIVLGADGTVQFWDQDTPQVRGILEAVKEMSTCDCPHDHCDVDEMPGWRDKLANGWY